MSEKHRYPTTKATHDLNEQFFNTSCSNTCCRPIWVLIIMQFWNFRRHFGMPTLCNTYRPIYTNRTRCRIQWYTGMAMNMDLDSISLSWNFSLILYLCIWMWYRAIVCTKSVGPCVWNHFCPCLPFMWGSTRLGIVNHKLLLNFFSCCNSSHK